MDRLIAAGLPSLLVWVLERNPSRRFYETLGGRPVAAKELEIAGVALREIAYGWTDARPLSSSAR